jgi:hypothetical protein
LTGNSIPEQAADFFTHDQLINYQQNGMGPVALRSPLDPWVFPPAATGARAGASGMRRIFYFFISGFAGGGIGTGFIFKSFAEPLPKP